MDTLSSFDKFVELYLSSDIATSTQKIRLQYLVYFQKRFAQQTYVDWSVDPGMKFASIYFPGIEGEGCALFLLDDTSLEKGLESMLLHAKIEKPSQLLLTGLDAKYVEPTIKFLNNRAWPGYEQTSFGHEFCFAWARPPTEVQESPSLDSLSHGEAEIVNSHWKYRSGRSLEAIQFCVAHHPSSGYKQDSKLLSWAISRSDGAIASLFTLEECRGKGVAKIVVKDLIDKLNTLTKGTLPAHCFIVKGNEQSERCFQGLGFQKKDCVSWIFCNS